MKFKWIFMMLVVLGIAFAFAIPAVMTGNYGPLNSIVEGVGYEPPQSSRSTRQSVLKWQDAQGNWHFGDEAPEGINVQTVTVDTAANILAPVKGLASKAPASPDMPDLGILPIATPAKAMEAFDQAKQVKAMMEQRNEALERRY